MNNGCDCLFSIISNNDLLKEFPLYIYIYIISILTTSGERDLNSNLYIFKAKAEIKYN